MIADSSCVPAHPVVFGARWFTCAEIDEISAAVT
jgi:hypothetical protein